MSQSFATQGAFPFSAQIMAAPSNMHKSRKMPHLTAPHRDVVTCETRQPRRDSCWDRAEVIKNCFQLINLHETCVDVMFYRFACRYLNCLILIVRIVLYFNIQPYIFLKKYIFFIVGFTVNYLRCFIKSLSKIIHKCYLHKQFLQTNKAYSTIPL